MKTIWRIAKTELNLLFYSPIAWFLLIIFIFQCGLAFTEYVERYLASQNAYGPEMRRMGDLTLRFFSADLGIFNEILRKVYLYIPLLTMGLISREISSGTIKLLHSSPVRIPSIVFGKFLSMMVYNLLLTAVVGVIMLFAAFNIRSADAGVFWSGLLGLYLLLCTYAAIGIFMSSLTAYQVVAAIGTLVVFALLVYAQMLWQDIDFVRDLTYFLSISGRAEKMTSGLITSKDLLYFVVIIGVFLGFTICRMRADIESVSMPVRATRYLAILVCALTIGYLTSRPGMIAYLDATNTKMHTLHPKSQRIIKEIGDAPLQVTSYINLLDRFYGYGTPERRNKDLDRWERYIRFKPNISFKYVYYYDSTLAEPKFFKYNRGLTLEQVADRYMKAYKVDAANFLTPAAIRKEIDLRPELNRYVMHLHYKGRNTFLRLFDDVEIWPSETETSVAFKRLLQSKFPRIVFLEGEYERSVHKSGDREFKTLTNDITFRHAMINQGFDVSVVSLKHQEIPADVSALVIADPKSDFDTTVLKKLQRYMDAGGNLLIVGEPGKQSVLNPLLGRLGVRLLDGMLVQPNKDLTPDFTQPYLTKTATGFHRRLEKSFKDSMVVYMPGVTGVSYTTGDHSDVQPLLLSDERVSWLKKNKIVLDSADIHFAPAEGDEKGRFATAIRLVRTINNKEQRIIIAGDADFLSNHEYMSRRDKGANFDFGTGLFGWLSYGEFPIDTYKAQGNDNWLDLTEGGATRMKIFLIGVLPGMVLLAGTILLIRRKRK